VNQIESILALNPIESNRFPLRRIHNVGYLNDAGGSRTKPRPSATCTKHLVKIAYCMWFRIEISLRQTYTQPDKHTHKDHATPPIAIGRI